MAPVLLRTTLAAFAALLGGLLGVSLGRASARLRLPLLLVGAAGVLLAVVVCDILPDAKAALSWPAFLVAGGTGWASLYLFNRYVYPVCPSCAFGEFDTGRGGNLRQTAAVLLCALGLHCLLDGVAVVVGDAMVRHANTGLLLAVTFHKLPEGFALAILLLAAGYTRHKTLAWTVLVESSTVAGGFLGVLLLRDASPALLGLLLAHVGGGFLFLVAGTLHALFEKTQPSTTRPRLAALCIASFTGTAGLLCFIRAFTS